VTTTESDHQDSPAPDIEPLAPVVIVVDEFQQYFDLWDGPVSAETAAKIRALLPERMVIAGRRGGVGHRAEERAH
jgi:hypothetical protein